MIRYGNAAAVAVICVIRGTWWRFRMRIRQWGRLPLRRGPTVLVANHQHEDESEIICERTFVQGPWRHPTFAASTRRMYEPGFFAGRLPASIETCKENGVAFNEIDYPAFRRAVEPVYTAFRAKYGSDLLDQILKATGAA